eukprot:CAMPEP_0174707142 /NCGR_PEP_ID=MMETSP1094-20130205/9740_1 /TAXON_ID=156173 /ORGANISM="Chrysochromulina brevifilum, Strain UTEX LB 985" /LENGTH=145 /DNA_ID=CAMNT_0015905481 /DNA_START=442 /DNA_END=880 /DNA_ORIENTATION=-
MTGSRGRGRSMLRVIARGNGDDTAGGIRGQSVCNTASEGGPIGVGVKLDDKFLGVDVRSDDGVDVGGDDGGDEGMAGEAWDDGGDGGMTGDDGGDGHTAGWAWDNITGIVHVGAYRVRRSWQSFLLPDGSHAWSAVTLKNVSGSR